MAVGEVEEADRGQLIVFGEAEEEEEGARGEQMAVGEAEEAEEEDEGAMRQWMVVKADEGPMR